MPTRHRETLIVQMETNALSGPDSTPASDGRVSIRFSKPESHSVRFPIASYFAWSKFGSAGCPAGALRRVGGNVKRRKGWSLVSFGLALICRPIRQEWSLDTVGRSRSLDLAEDGPVRDALPKGGVRGIGTFRREPDCARSGRAVCAPCCAGVGRGISVHHPLTPGSTSTTVIPGFQAKSSIRRDGDRHHARGSEARARRRQSQRRGVSTDSAGA